MKLSDFNLPANPYEKQLIKKFRNYSRPIRRELKRRRYNDTKEYIEAFKKSTDQYYVLLYHTFNDDGEILCSYFETVKKITFCYDFDELELLTPDYSRNYIKVISKNGNVHVTNIKYICLKEDIVKRNNYMILDE